MRQATQDDKMRIKELERALARKDRALAETAALLVLGKRRQRSGGPLVSDGEDA